MSAKDRHPETQLGRDDRRATFFIADDDDDFRWILASALSQRGFHVDEAANGAVALTCLASAADGRTPRPDVIVLDVRMPTCSGLGVLHAIRRLTTSVPTILMTGLSERSIETVARRFGAIAVLRKPFDIEDLVRAALPFIEPRMRRHHA